MKRIFLSLGFMLSFFSLAFSQLTDPAGSFTKAIGKSPEAHSTGSYSFNEVNTATRKVDVSYESVVG